MQTLTHVNRLAMVVKFWNHWKTTEEPDEQLKYVSSEMEAVTMMQ